MNSFSFTLEPLPPFRLDLTAWALRRRPDNLIDRWDGRIYRRALFLNSGPVEVAVRQIDSPEKPKLQVDVSNETANSIDRESVAAALTRMLSLQTDLAAFYQMSASDPRLVSLVRRFRGLKPPCYPTLYECLVNAIACQQVTLTLGLRLVNRLAEVYGPALMMDEGPSRCLPQPGTIAALDVEALRALQFSRQKAQALIEIAKAIGEDGLSFKEISDLDDDAAQAYLLKFRGVGRWTAEYVLLRGLGRLHIFPGDDVGARNGLRHWLGLQETLDYSGVNNLLAGWQPYAGMLYFHLLLNRLEEEGYVSADSSGVWGYPV